MKGHTDRATINSRRPLTDNMRVTLKGLDPRRGGKPVNQDTLHHTEKSAMRALMDRGYATPSPDGIWSITDAGMAAVDPLGAPQ
jgi:hypothetical protein